MKKQRFKLDIDFNNPKVTHRGIEFDATIEPKNTQYLGTIIVHFSPHVARRVLRDEFKLQRWEDAAIECSCAGDCNCAS